MPQLPSFEPGAALHCVPSVTTSLSEGSAPPRPESPLPRPARWRSPNLPTYSSDATRSGVA
eukprot:6049229-Pyramimonas_sp.AAC.1